MSKRVKDRDAGVDILEERLHSEKIMPLVWLLIAAFFGLIGMASYASSGLLGPLLMCIMAIVFCVYQISFYERHLYHLSLLIYLKSNQCKKRK